VAAERTVPSTVSKKMTKHCKYPVKTGHVDSKYSLLHNKSFLSTATEYLWSVTCTIKATKCFKGGKFYDHTVDQKKKCHDS